MIRYHRIRNLILAGYLMFLPLVLTGCPPKPPCDEKIENPQVYAKTILSHPVVVRVSSELRFVRFNMAECFVDGKAIAYLTYELPTAYSQYGIPYRDKLMLSYAKDGTIGIASAGIRYPPSLEYEAIVDFFKGKAQEVEGNPRVKEFIAKLELEPRNLPVLLYNTGVRIYGKYGNSMPWIEYSLHTRLVRGYLLPNALDWQQFPEIKHAHKVIGENLLVGDLSRCSVGRSASHSYTATDFHDFEPGPWSLSVALICDNGWKDAYVRINPDGSYQELRIERSY